MKLGKILPVAFLSMALLSPVTYARYDFCKEIYKAAYKVEMARQKGIPAYKFMDRVQNAKMLKVPKKLRKDIRKLMKVMILDAYDKVEMPTEELQKMQESEFANKWYLKCEKD